MKLLSVVASKMTNSMGKVGLKLTKAAPDILVAAGIGGLVGATVWLIKNEEKRKEILEDFAEERENIEADKEILEEMAESGNTEAVECPSDAPEASYSGLVVKSYVEVAGRLAGLYAAPVALYGVSLACILKSHYILKGRVAGLAAAYECLDRAYKRYRGNVVERYGEEVDKDMAYGRKKETIIESHPDPETGEEIVETSERMTYNVPLGGSEFGRWFEQGGSWEFEKNNPIYNMTYVVGVQAQLDNLLHARGHVFLNEAYDALGFERTPEGAVVGWILGAGDDCIDFGINDKVVWVKDRWHGDGDELTVVGRDDYDGFRQGFWLDFNHDGVIFDKI